MSTSNKRIAVATPKEEWLAAIEKLAAPLAEMIVRSGVMVRDVNVILERACVAVARDRLEEGGTKQNLTRVSLRTGIDRKKVRRYSQELDSDCDYGLETQIDVITMVLSKWHTESEYLDADGLPRPLRQYGPGPCLRDLVETCGKDLSTRVIVTEMLRSKTICEDRGFYVPRKRGYFPAKSSQEAIQIMSVAVRDLLETMNYNLHLKRTREDGRYQSYSMVRIPQPQLAECRKEIKRRLDIYLNDIDTYLTIKRASLADGETTVRFGVGFYEIQGEGGIPEKDT